jgi:hypothetical protein
MVQQGVMTGKPLIESDRVEGTTVYDPQGNNIGSIKRLMIEKISGRVAYAVMSFGGFLGMGAEEHAIPWGKLTYDTSLGGYRTDITEQQLRGAPTFTRDRDWDWSDRSRERQLHDPSAVLLGLVTLALLPEKPACGCTAGGLATTEVQSPQASVKRASPLKRHHLARSCLSGLSWRCPRFYASSRERGVYNSTDD